MKLDWPGTFRYRAPELTYERLPGKLFITAREQFSLTSFAITGLILIGTVLYAVLRPQALGSGTALWIIVICGCCWSFYTTLHPDTATLEVTALSARARSRQGSGEILRTDLGQLQFLAGDGENDSPQGLYSSHAWNTTLLLPYLTEEQSHEVIDEIYKVFPDTPSGPAYPSDIITLNLNR